jgi:flagellar basal-body rod protein FlgG
MGDALVTAIHSMQLDQRRMEAISRNIASAMLPGYQREAVSVQPFGSVYEAAAQPAPVVTTDVRAGALTQTGKPFDLALAGPGYFAVQAEQGVAYTRAGNFHLDGSGRLVTARGLPVLSENGEIVLRGRAAAIDEQGRIRQDGQVIGQLKVAQFARPERLQRGADGLLYAGAQDPAAAPARTVLRPGYLEGSNSQGPAEMAGLAQAMRAFEGAQKVYQIYDEQLRNAVQELGKF